MTTRRHRLSALLGSMLAVAALAGCGDDPAADEASPTSAEETSPAAPSSAPAAETEATTPAPVTTARATDAPTTAPTQGAPTTVATTRPTPTTIPLPVPAAPPADPEAPEPVVELGTLAIPKIGLESTLYEGLRIPTFDLGPGHWPGTAMPGKPGNMVVGGHRTASNADFRHLDQLAAGDEMIVTTPDGGSSTYVVDSVEITDPFAARVIYQTPERTATLFACHPPGSIRQRIVVHLTLAA